MDSHSSPSPISNDKETHLALLQATATIVSGLVDRNTDEAWNLGDVLREVYTELALLSSEMMPATPHAHAASLPQSIAVGDSIHQDYIVCLEDGKKLKMLKRYLKTNYNLTPEEYRKRWNLPATYPMVAPEYALRRSQLAKDIGLGKEASRIKRMNSRASQHSVNA